MSRSKKDILDTEAMLQRLRYVLDTYATPELPVDQTTYDAEALRRISMTLHRWHELECGVDNGGLDQDESTGKWWWYNSHTGKRTHIVPDREKGARKRLAAIMARYPNLVAYVQGDPRGCALYIVKSGDVPQGEDVSAYYSRGLAVHR